MSKSKIALAAIILGLFSGMSLASSTTTSAITTPTAPTTSSDRYQRALDLAKYQCNAQGYTTQGKVDACIADRMKSYGY